MCQKSRWWRTVLVFAGLLTLLIYPPAALAANKLYIGPVGTGSWHLAANWSPSGAPVTGDSAALATAGTTTRTVVYAGTGSFLFTYGTIIISNNGSGSITLQNGTAGMLGTNLNIGPHGKYFLGAPAFANFSTVGISGGTLEGASLAPFGSSDFSANDYNQTGGLVENGDFRVGHSYLLQGGSISGLTTIINNGTFDYTGGGAANGAMINNGTLIYSGSGSLNFDLTNNGTIIFNANASFHSLANPRSMTVPANRNLTAASFISQDGGTFTQLSGTVAADAINVTNAAWDQVGGIFFPGHFSIGGDHADGSYFMRTGMLSGSATQPIEIGGIASSGSFLQSGGDVTAETLIVGAKTGSSGHYRISSGSLFDYNLVVGATDAAAASFVQEGGSVTVVDSLSINKLTSGGAGALSITGGTLKAFPMVVNDGAITQSSGVATFSTSLVGSGSLTMTGGALITPRIIQSSVQLSGNAKIFFTTEFARVGALRFDESGNSVHGSWDLADGALVVDYAAGEPSPIAAVQRYIKSGYASGSWNGTGLSSFFAAAQNPADTALGFAESSKLLGPSGGFFEGEPVDGSSVLVKYTLYGDANLDATVDSVDFNLLAANFGSSDKGWLDGDFDYNGAVDSIDFNLLSSNFGQVLTAEAARPTAALVPEPSLIWIGILAPLLAARRRLRFNARLMR